MIIDKFNTHFEGIKTGVLVSDVLESGWVSLSSYFPILSHSCPIKNLEKIMPLHRAVCEVSVRCPYKLSGSYWFPG